MSITTVLFDLDGTLLPMDQDHFAKHYFGLLAKKLALRGYDAQALIGAIWAGIKAMVKNEGKITNEEAFWRCFCSIFGEKAREDMPIFDEYYRHEFQQVQSACGFTEDAARTVALVKEKGLTAVLATNPVFPAIATESRMRWAGLRKEDFILYTTYENFSYCKPNLAYYRDILEKIGAKPEECLMVGNDVAEDMIARELGMQVFLLTDCLINKEGKDISCYPHGSFPQLIQFIENL